ncbi:MAG: type II toxin-antitoxin system RelE/ParE family toxin [Pseudaminobacter sp.]|nr:type II toxin-antitoxin system RelE/ParE family toxin [Pseudaminobacter sp.]
MNRHIFARAAQDLADIEAHISADNRQAGAAVASSLRRAFDLIAARPEIGRPLTRPNIREWSVPGLPYVIPYRVRPDRIEILRVFHTSRKRPTEWQ